MLGLLVFGCLDLLHSTKMRGGCFLDVSFHVFFCFCIAVLLDTNLICGALSFSRPGASSLASWEHKKGYLGVKVFWFVRFAVGSGTPI